MIQFLVKHRWFCVSFLPLYFLFLYPLMALQKGFVIGDYSLQFYPWLWAYAKALKEGYLLLWTPLIQSGFPLFAEGQTGMLYALNLLLFKWLPFKAAYNTMFLAHFFMGGVFTYLFCLRKGLSPAASALSAILFTFGSAFAGCFYNIVTMRTLVWFPLALYLVERYFGTRSLTPLFLLALVQGQSWLAGFPQTAAYSAFFLVLYFFIRLGEEPLEIQDKQRKTLFFLLSLVLSVVIGMPQLWATLSLAKHSTRILQDPSFALWGSVAPWSVVTVFMYSWGAFLKYKVYIGAAPLFLILLSPSWKSARIFWILAGLSFFLALGMFNPLYWALLKLPLVSLLRNPSKFLFFTAFFLSVIAGFSYDALRQAIEQGGEPRKKFLGKGFILLLSFFILAVGAYLFAAQASPFLIKFGHWYVDHFVSGKSFHGGSPELYAHKVQAIFQDVREELDPRNPFFLLPFIFGALFIGLLFLVNQRKIRQSVFQAMFFILVMADLFIFGKSTYGTGFIGNMGPFPDVSLAESFEKDGRWLDLNTRQEALFPANRNMLTGHALVGAYSPLLDKDYYVLTKDFGVLDDSFGRTKVSRELLDKHSSLVDFLGVKYIVTNGHSLPNRYRLLRHEGQKKIYENPQAQSEFTLLPKRSGTNGFNSVDILKNGPMAVVLGIQSSEGGTLVRNQTWDEGWKVFVDGKRGELRRANTAFQGVEVPKGGHRVEFHYAPDSFIIGRWFHLFGLLTAVGGILLQAMRPRVKGN